MDLPACPVETTLMLIGDKWKILILRGVMSGIPDWYVGECVFTAIEDEKFYIFTHPESQVVAQPRVQRLASGINPKT